LQDWTRKDEVAEVQIMGLVIGGLDNAGLEVGGPWMGVGIQN